jgi:hypothetical protein
VRNETQKKVTAHAVRAYGHELFSHTSDTTIKTLLIHAIQTITSNRDFKHSPPMRRSKMNQSHSTISTLAAWRCLFMSFDAGYNCY